ncbi:MAG TPA: hypothetical protein VFG63_01685 [Nocardioidaceae bacterium]|nr:hypothetical protein [Nocardioidaceae bacterium]
MLEAKVNALATRPGTSDPESAATLAGVYDLLRRAREAAYRVNPIPTRWAIWWRGTLIEAAYQNLHAAEALIVRLYDPDEVDAEITEAVARVEAGLNRDDPRRTEARLILQMRPESRKRLELSKLVEIGYAAADRQHSRLRSFRNRILASSALISLFLVVFVVAVAFDPTSVPICFQPNSQGPMFCPTGGDGATSGDVLVVALLGLMGGALAAAVAMRNLRGTSTPYEVASALAVLKVPFGALTAIGALIALRGDFIPGLSALDSQGQILAYALVFGYAQQLLTGLIDKQAQTLLEHVPSKDSEVNRPELLPAWSRLTTGATGFAASTDPVIGPAAPRTAAQTS